MASISQELEAPANSMPSPRPRHAAAGHRPARNTVREIANGGVQCMRNLGVDLIKQHGLDGTFQIIDVGRLARLAQAFREAMPRVQPYYSVKCNPHNGIMGALADAGCGFDAASASEVHAALAAGVPARSIILANTCKCPADIRTAASVGVTKMTFDCEDELDKIAELFPSAELVLRIRADDLSAQIQFGDKFGADAATEAPALLAAALCRGLTVIGVSFHVGSGSETPDAYRAAIHAARFVFDEAAAVGACLRLLDIGGGFYGRFLPDGSVDLAAVAAVVNDALHECFPVQQYGDLEVIAEPGRYFAETCMTLFAMVHTVRTRPNGHRMYHITDGLHGSFALMQSGRRTVRAHLLRSPTLPQPPAHDAPVLFRSTVYGPTLDSMDRIFENLPMPLLRRGDWLQFADQGAYGMCFATKFNGFAAAEAPTFYARSHEPVAKGGEAGMKVLSQGVEDAGHLWPWHEQELSFTCTPADLGIHCAESAPHTQAVGRKGAG
eukprot:jgi/Ulvmu1/12297/UM088_0015.1